MYLNATFDSFSFGCRVNEAEKIELDKEMIKSGYSKTSKNPDFYIINTCCVTAKAEREARQLILKIKRNNPKTKVIVTGCSATYWLKNHLWQNMPIDLIISNSDKTYLVSFLQKKFNIHNRFGLKKKTNINFLKLDKFLASGRLLLKIQDGCHRFCSYCIVPYLRGNPHSTPVQSLIEKVNFYLNLQEVVYTAINTESFGHDTNETLLQLIDETIKKTRVRRISFGSIHPWSIDEQFIKYYKSIIENERFSHFFHVPLQSGSNKMLTLMKREYKASDVIDKLYEFKRIDPYTFISTDVIVGFLDENDKDFQNTYNLLKTSPIDRFHIFRFSVRQNTAAYYMKKRLFEPTDQEKVKRAKALSKLSEKKYAVFLKSLLGYTSSGLGIGSLKDGLQTYILNNQVRVLVKSKKTDNGQMRMIKVTDFKRGVLWGKDCGPDRT